MKAEIRNMKALMYAGITEILLGIVFWLTGIAEWYNTHFHFFGIIGLGLCIYACWLYFFYLEDHPIKKGKLADPMMDNNGVSDYDR